MFNDTPAQKKTEKKWPIYFLSWGVVKHSYIHSRARVCVCVCVCVCVQH